MKLLFSTYGPPLCALILSLYQYKSKSTKITLNTWPPLYTYNTRKTIFLKVYQVTNKLYFQSKNKFYAKSF